MANFRHSRRSFVQFCWGLSVFSILAACQTAPPSPESQTLKVGISDDNAPWTFKDDSGELVGFEVDMIKAIAAELDVTPEFIGTPFVELFPAVSSGRIDLAAASITITDKRLETADFTQPFYDSDQSLTAKVGGDVQGLQDLAGKKVVVETGTTGGEWVEQNRERYKIGEVFYSEDNFDISMAEVADGVLDAYVTDIPAALYHTQMEPQLEVVERIPTGEQYGLMFAKENPLRDEFSTVITQFKEDGTLAEIHEKWFGSPPDPQTSTVVVEPIPSL